MYIYCYCLKPFYTAACLKRLCLAKNVMGLRQKSTGLTQHHLLSKIFDTEQDSVSLRPKYSYKLLFVRQDPSSITLGEKPSHGRSCHLEADLFPRLSDSTPPLFLICLYSSISFSITPTPCSAVCLDQTAPASISDSQTISGTAPLTVVCLSVSLQSTHCWRERKLNPSGT